MKKFKNAKESQVVLSQLMLPSHSNFSGKIHGGFILNLMDQVAFACASRHSGNYCVTASVDKVDFLNAIEVGEMVNLKAQVNYTGKTSMVIGLRVESENIRTGEMKHCNSSYFTMVAKDEQGNNCEVPGLILDNINSVRRFVRSIKLKQSDNRQENLFGEENFVMDNYLTLLEKHNAKLKI
ncbi:MAG: acyl-CoA thioesterase [Bacteroidota bacterium]